MFGIGGMEFVLILIVALVVLGPDHLPRIMRMLGKTAGDLRRASTEFQRTMNVEMARDELARTEQDAKTTDSVPAPPSNVEPAGALPGAAAGASPETGGGSGPAARARPVPCSRKKTARNAPFPRRRPARNATPDAAASTPDPAPIQAPEDAPPVSSAGSARQALLRAPRGRSLRRRAAGFSRKSP